MQSRAPSLLSLTVMLSSVVTAAGAFRPAAARGGTPGSAGAGGATVAVAATDTTAEPVPPPWQQEVGYTIEARLDEDAGVIRAAQVVRYRNASPDTLDRLYFHLHLNAFRPHSEWARAEKREDYPFGELEEPDFGFERLRRARLVAGPGAPAREGGLPGVVTGEMGVELSARYPHAPDSTVVRFDLPEPLPPGGEAVLRLRWDARPATLCRRQCRRGRSWDLAQWYPRVAVYDWGGWEEHPLYPQGEFYGEFATYDVTLDLADDQVVGATGVPVEGDPGWRPGEGSPLGEPPYQRDWYGVAGLEPPAPRPDLLPDSAGPGRKRVRFHARDVHHFAWSSSPEYRYEAGLLERGTRPDVAVHVLHRPGDSAWADGTAVERTVRALSWLESVFGPYPYPQLTNLHRLEGGGTEFPMVIMNGGVSMGLIAHETTHQYAHGVLGSNEWKEAWLDEGLASFLDAWFAEEHGDASWDEFMERTGQLEGALSDPSVRGSPPPELSGLTVDGDTLPAPLPIDTRSEAFANYGQYGYLSYSKPQAVFYMLREMLGKEPMRRILRTYFERYEFRHVNEAAFRQVAEDMSGRRLDWFFDQWLDATATLDYALSDVSLEAAGEDGWRTRVTVRRHGEAWMPVTLRVGEETVRLDSRDRERTVTVATAERPETVELDPGHVLLDVDPTNDSRQIDEE